jgi:pimeloyl-ACP methyl ester carboxylesterase
VQALVIGNSAASMPRLIRGFDRVKAALGPDTVRMMAVREAEGTTEHPRIHRGAHTTDVSPYGDWDYLLPEYLRLTHEHLPNSELVIFQDSGHLPFWDAADR